jgi:hypothetical protein
MRNSGSVCLRQPVGHLEGEIEHLACRQGPRTENFSKRFPLDELHYHVINGIDLAYLVDSNDIRMVQGRCRLRFELKAPDSFRVRRRLPEQYFNRNLASELGVSRPVDIPHPTRSQQAEDLVYANRSPNHRPRFFLGTQLSCDLQRCCLLEAFLQILTFKHRLDFFAHYVVPGTGLVEESQPLACVAFRGRAT